MLIKDLALENIKILQKEFQRIKPLIKDEIISVIIDGSIIRGDFCDYSSDIDLTITTLNTIVDVGIKNKIEEVIKRVQSILPKREYPRKPLVYDIQWQDINLVKETGNRKIVEWNIYNIPKGYPKLWFYAFDSIKYHKVILGEDVTELYTKISPTHFVPLRLNRIKKSAQRIGGNISTYEAEYGAITQIKNAWEAIRCVCIANGLVSLHKNHVYTFATKLFGNKKDLELIKNIKEFYVNNNSNLITGDFRDILFHFTLKVINECQFGKKI